MKKVLPIGENILVKVEKEEKKTQSGIVLPETASGEKPQEGIVIERGDSEKIDGKIKKGARVIFAKYSGSELEIEKEDYLLLKAEDILAVVE